MNEPRIVLYTGVIGMIEWNTMMAKSYFGLYVKFFSMSRAKRQVEHFVWYIPYYKGNLWKIKADLDKTFRVYYGTKEICFAGDLKSALKVIPEYRDRKHEIWKIKMSTKI